MLEPKDKENIEHSLKMLIEKVQIDHDHALKRCEAANKDYDQIKLKLNSLKVTLSKFTPDFEKDFGRYDPYWSWWQKGEFAIMYYDKILTVPEIFTVIQSLEVLIRNAENKRSLQASLSGALAEKSEGVFSKLKRYKYNSRDYVYGLPKMFDKDMLPLREYCTDEMWHLIKLNTETGINNVAVEDEDLPF
jgi:hypothetical protein